MTILILIVIAPSPGFALLKENYCIFGSGREFCPEPGTTNLDQCYYGQRVCDLRGCQMYMCSLGIDEECNARLGCIPKTTVSGALGFINYKHTYYDDYDYYNNYYYNNDYCYDYPYCSNDNYDSRFFCKNDDVYRRYIVYNGVNYTTIDTLVENCPEVCRYGRCTYDTDCENLEIETGARYCKNGNVYVEIRKYFEIGYECDSVIQEKIIDKCKYGCVDSQCVFSSYDYYCSDPSGYAGEKRCWNKQSYTCSDGKWITPQNVQCCTNSDCTTGSCVNNACTNSGIPISIQTGYNNVITGCNDLDTFISDRACNGNNVVAEFRNYNADCTYEDKTQVLQVCINGCTNGACNEAVQCNNYCSGDMWFYNGYSLGGTCTYSRQNCAEKNSCAWTEWYDIGKGMKERRHECSTYSCIDGCQKTGVITKLEQQPAEPQHRNFLFNISVSTIRENDVITLLDEKIYNGIIFGEKNIKINASAFVTDISFVVNETNEYASLLMYADNYLTYANITKKGSYTVLINQTASEIKIASESSFWKLWSPSIYRLENIHANIIKEIVNDQKFTFKLNELSDNFIVKAPDEVSVEINNIRIPVNKVIEGSILKTGDNIIRFSSHDAFTGSISMEIETRI